MPYRSLFFFILQKTRQPNVFYPRVHNVFVVSTNNHANLPRHHGLHRHMPGRIKKGRMVVRARFSVYSHAEK